MLMVLKIQKYMKLLKTRNETVGYVITWKKNSMPLLIELDKITFPTIPTCSPALQFPFSPTHSSLWKDVYFFLSFLVSLALFERN